MARDNWIGRERLLGLAEVSRRSRGISQVAEFNCLPTQSFIVHANASQEGLGAALYQEQKTKLELLVWRRELSILQIETILCTFMYIYRKGK